MNIQEGAIQRGTAHATSRHLISVVIPAFNAAATLEEAIGSVLSQTYRTIEVIVVDDGSTDSTPEIIARFTSASEAAPGALRVRARRTTNRGVAAARNTGIEMARGDVVAFLDADDTYYGDKLRLQAARLASDPEVGMVHCGWDKTTADGILIESVEPWKVAPLLDLPTWLLWKPINTSMLTARREWLQRVGGFDVSLTHSEDLDLVLRLAGAGCRAAWVTERLGTYRQGSESAMADCERLATDTDRVLTRFFADDNLSEDALRVEKECLFYTYEWLAQRCLERRGPACALPWFIKSAQTGFTEPCEIIRLRQAYERGLGHIIDQAKKGSARSREADG
jgi:glycosyltransferase involved in cell wall biosynthesis